MLVTISSTVIMPISVMVMRRLIRAKANMPTSALTEVSKTRNDAPRSIFTAESGKLSMHLRRSLSDYDTLHC
ncbi:MAG: hypothetical protein NTX81_10680 [Candidatus Bathyarchaeota archaeon]|nr:hypothetical protein [Candidatus Bathyarchaeota archaeon]